MRDIGRSVSDRVFENLGRAAGRVHEETPLAADVLESEDDYLVVFDAPGVDADDVQVRYLENEVEVRIDRFRDHYDEFEMRYPGRGLSLEGTATLPDDAVVDPSAATATLRSTGTLAVRLPKVDDPVDEDVEEVDEREGAGAPVDAADEAGERDDSEVEPSAGDEQPSE